MRIRLLWICSYSFQFLINYQNSVYTFIREPQTLVQVIANLIITSSIIKSNVTLRKMIFMTYGGRLERNLKFGKFYKKHNCFVNTKIRITFTCSRCNLNNYYGNSKYIFESANFKISDSFSSKFAKQTRKKLKKEMV